MRHSRNARRCVYRRSFEPIVKRQADSASKDIFDEKILGGSQFPQLQVGGANLQMTVIEGHVNTECYLAKILGAIEDIPKHFIH